MDKVVVIDHSYHKKTKSSSFIIDLLRERYEVEIIYDESWYSGKEPNLCHIDESYIGVIFWQNISESMLKSISNKNVIYFPMYDACHGVPLDYWYDIKNVKVVSFSSTLYEKLECLGFQIMQLKFFPEPIKLEIQKEKTLFFWHRLSGISWNAIKKLFPNEKIEHVHIHKAVDPDQKFVQPSEEDEMKYNIHYSEWFESKQEYLEKVESKSIYVAPRNYEGIGFSFLEAMAMGKVVVAANNPTMNEYIIHGVNGLLFDDKDPKPLLLDDFELMQKNAYDTIVEGRLAWNREKNSIFEFIEKEPRENSYFRNKFNVELKKIHFKQMIKKTIKYVLPYGIVKLYQNRKR